MPPKAVKPTWDILDHFLVTLKICSLNPDENSEAQSIQIKIAPTQAKQDQQGTSNITTFHHLFLRLMSNDEKPPKKANYNPTYVGSSIFRISDRWLVGGDLVDGSGKNGNAVLDYTEDQLRINAPPLKLQDALKEGTVILPSRARYEFGSIFSILLDSNARHLQNDVIVIGQITEGFEDLVQCLQDFGYIGKEDEKSFSNEVETIENGLIVIESCQIVTKT